MGEPNLFIIGAPKCGTTSLYYYLGQHPDVNVSSRKEPHYLASDLDWVEGWGVENKKEYESLYDMKKKINIDASTWYLYSELARKKIAENYPNSKVIVCLRHPVNFMDSLWWHLKARGKESSKDLIEALEKENAIKKGASFRPAPFRKSVLYRECACFSIFIKKYLDVLGPDRIKVILLEDLAENPEKTIKAVVKYLDLNYVKINNYEVKNSATAAEFLWLKSLARKYKIINSLAYAESTKKLRMNFKYLIHKSKVIRRKNRIWLSEEDWHDLNIQFSEEVQSLSKLVGRDLGHWCKTYNRII